MTCKFFSKMCDKIILHTTSTRIRTNYLDHKLWTPNESKKSEILWMNVADKYASAVSKNLGLGCSSRPCSAGHFLIANLDN